MERINITLLGREYTLACAPSEKADLLSAVAHVEKRMKRVQDSGKVVGNERIASMVAIQLALEFLTLRAPDGPLSNLALGDFQRRIEDMHQLIDQVVGPEAAAR
ncbi:MAG: cell division protein ZapA [Paenalcaligenes sp.]